jgi:hypothetical protein
MKKKKKIPSSVYNFSAKNKFDTPEKIPLRLLFWYYEYLKRFVFLTERKFFDEILNYTFNILRYLKNNATYLVNREDQYEIINLLKTTIREHCQVRSGLKKPDPSNKFLMDINRNHKGAYLNTALETLCDATEKYGYFAYSLVRFANMEDILRKINSDIDIDVADFACDMYGKEEPELKSKIVFTPSLDDPNICNGDMQISLNILNNDFNFDNMVDDIKNIITLRRTHCIALGKNIELSQSEKSVIAKNILPENVKRIKEAACKSRAIGLWCYDRKNSIYDGDTPISCNLSAEKLLYELAEKQLLKEFRKDEPNCENLEFNCASTVIGYKGHNHKTIKDRTCVHIDSCKRKLSSIIKNTAKCIQTKQIIDIMSK